MAELIERLKEIGFEIKVDDDDWVYVMHIELEDGTAQISIVRK